MIIELSDEIVKYLYEVFKKDPHRRVPLDELSSHVLGSRDVNLYKVEFEGALSYVIGDGYVIEHATYYHLTSSGVKHALRLRHEIYDSDEDQRRSNRRNWIIGVISILVPILLLFFNNRTSTSRDQNTLIDSQESEAPAFVLATPTNLLEFIAPDQFVKDYWDLVSSRRYEEAWIRLHPDFQQVNHENQLEDYKEGFKDICTTKAQSVSIIQQTGEAATVSARLVFHEGTSCEQTLDQDFYFYLVLNPKLDSWLISRSEPR